MTKNRLSDLNDHLFAQMERLADEGLSPEDLEKEVQRAASMVEVADRITENAKLTLTAAKLFAEHGAQVLPYLPKIGTPAPVEGPK
jgi:glycerol-3-phosphate dehydrogenase